MDRLSQSPDVNPVQNPWNTLKRAVHRRSTHNPIDLEHFCKDEWKSTGRLRCAQLLDSYPNTQFRLTSRRCFNKVLVKGCEHLCNQVVVRFFVSFPTLKGGGFIVQVWGGLSTCPGHTGWIGHVPVLVCTWGRFSVFWGEPGEPGERQ